MVRPSRRDLIQFFEDDMGRLSITRLRVLLVTIASLLVVGWCTVYKEPDDAIGVVATLMGIASADKIAKNYYEQQEKALRPTLPPENPQ